MSLNALRTDTVPARDRSTSDLVLSPAPVVLDDVSWDVWALDSDIEEGAVWPPRQFRARDGRLALLRSLWEGGFGPDESLGPNRVGPNPFSQYSTRLANFLLLSEPTVAGEVPDEADVPMLPTPGETNDLVDVAHDALINLTRDGGCVLLLIDGALAVPDSATWYPLAGGGDVLARLWSDPAGRDGEDGALNRLDLTVIRDGMAERTTHEYDGERIGSPVGAPEMWAAEIEIVARDPRRGIWGTTAYIAMFSAAYEIARRLSRNSRVLDLYSGPMPVITESLRDAERRFDIPPDTTAAQRDRMILEGQLGMLAEDSIHLPDATMGVTFLQPHVQGASYALQQVTDLRAMLREITGLPDLTGTPLSGRALIQIHLHFYAESSPLQAQLRRAMERLLGVMIDWPHPFDTDMFDAPTGASPGSPTGTPPEPGPPRLTLVEEAA